jgi:PadR family transcriptional regulator PadR
MTWSDGKTGWALVVHSSSVRAVHPPCVMIQSMGRATPSMATLKVFRSLLEVPTAGRYGLELIDSSGVKAGALYPILNRLERDGLVEGVWEDIDERREGRRRRRYYRLTAAGQSEAVRVLKETIRQLTPVTGARTGPDLGWLGDLGRART